MAQSATPRSSAGTSSAKGTLSVVAPKWRKRSADETLKVRTLASLKSAIDAIGFVHQKIWLGNE